MVKNKKSFIRIIEALIAIVILFLFLMYFINISDYNQKQGIEKEDKYLLQFEDNIGFRNCVYEYNMSCLNNFLDVVIPAYYGFDVIVNENPGALSGNLPEDKIVKSESMLIAKNQTFGGSASLIVRLYYWKK